MAVTIKSDSVLTKGQHNAKVTCTDYVHVNIASFSLPDMTQQDIDDAIELLEALRKFVGE